MSVSIAVPLSVKTSESVHVPYTSRYVAEKVPAAVGMKRNVYLRVLSCGTTMAYGSPPNCASPVTYSIHPNETGVLPMLCKVMTVSISLFTQMVQNQLSCRTMPVWICSRLHRSRNTTCRGTMDYPRSFYMLLSGVRFVLDGNGKRSPDCC